MVQQMTIPVAGDMPLTAAQVTSSMSAIPSAQSIQGVTPTISADEGATADLIVGSTSVAPAPVPESPAASLHPSPNEVEITSPMSTVSPSDPSTEDVTTINATGESVSDDAMSGSAGLTVIPSSQPDVSAQRVIDAAEPNLDISAMEVSSSPSPDTPQPLETFTCFGKLPAELRFKIWKEAANEPRVLKFDIPRALIRDKSPWSTAAIKSILSVNKESRLATPSFDGIQELCDVPENLKELEKIRRIATNRPRVAYYTSGILEQAYRALPNLTEITTLDLGLYDDDFMAAKFRIATPTDISSFDWDTNTRFHYNKHKYKILDFMQWGVWKGSGPTFRFAMPLPSAADQDSEDLEDLE